MGQLVIWLFIFATSVGVGIDASQLGARRGALGGGMLDMGPAGWFFACLLFWIIGFPCYLVARGRLVRRRDGLAYIQRNRLQPVGAFAAAGAGAASQVAPPGWYADPSGRPQWRWWTGDRWTNDFR